MAISRGRTISHVSFWALVGFSWISILLIGSAWVWVAYQDFVIETDRLREDHYATQRALVRKEAGKGVAIVQAVRENARRQLRRNLEVRVRIARSVGRFLAQSPKEFRFDTVLRRSVANLMASRADENALNAVRGQTVFLLSPVPAKVNREDLLAEVATALTGIRNGSLQLSVSTGDIHGPCKLMLIVQQFEQPDMRIVAGGCLETVDRQARGEAVQRLEAYRYGENGTLFGGTLNGDVLFGPGKGENMWGLTDLHGVKIVQELISAARNGGGFVQYIMPPLKGQRNTGKVSYALPVPGWEWYVGTGAYIDDIEETVAANRETLRNSLLLRVGIIAVGLILLSFFAFAVSRLFSRSIRANALAFTRAWKQLSFKGQAIDIDTLSYAEFIGLAKAANAMTAERESAQLALEESVQRFSMLVSNIPGIVYRCEADGGWANVYISEAVYDITGYPAHEFLRDGVRTFRSIIHPDDQAWVKAAFQEDMKYRQIFVADYRIIRADGEVRWLSERGRAMYDDSGEAKWMDGVIFDVTERKLAEEKHFSHVHFLETLERVDRAMHDAVDTEGMLSSALEALRQAFGADRAWVLTPCDPDASFFLVPALRAAPEYPVDLPPDMRVPMAGSYRSVAADAIKSPIPVPYGADAERPVPVDAVTDFGVKSQLVFAIRHSSGIPWLLGLHQCRNERSWTENELRLFKEVGRLMGDALDNALMRDELAASEEKFRTFSEQTMLALCVVQDNRVVFANQAYADIFEITIKEMKALPSGAFIKYVHPDDREFLLEQARKKQAGETAGVVNKYVWRAVTETGRVRWVEIHSKTAMVNGRTADLISLVDITDRKRAEENLEGVIAERTADLKLKAEELERANEHLRKLDELKSSFLTTVSHAMRTPLTSVLGFARLVRRDLDRAGNSTNCVCEHHGRVVENLEIMEDEGQRLKRLVDQFIELTALEAGTDLRTGKAHPVDGCIERAVAKARDMLAEKPEVQLLLDVEAGLPEMAVDIAKLEQVLEHLLHNAVTYTESGHIRFRVGSRDGEGLEMAIEDTGKGIPSADLEAVFEPFHQVETSDTLVDTIKGAGLGLALCRLIIERMGGEIRAESALGRGTVFSVVLPGATPV